jgi:hypothetical protein
LIETHMQGTNNGQGNQNGQKQSSLSWSQPPQSSGGAASAKPISQVTTSPVQSKISPPKAENKPAAQASKSYTSNSSSGGAGRMAGMFAAGVVVGLIVGWGWSSLRTTPADVAVNENGTQTGAVATSGTNTGTPTGSAGGTNSGTSVSSGSTAGQGSLSVAAQAAGAAVAISSFSVGEPTWIVVFDNNNGVPGNALGAAMFFPGQSSGTIELLRATVAGKSYLVGEYVDNGDHIFSKQQDTQVKNIAGAPLLVEFSAR